MPVKSHRRTDKNTFYNVGLGGKNGQLDFRHPGNWRVESFADIKLLLGHKGVSAHTFSLFSLATLMAEFFAISQSMNQCNLRLVYKEHPLK